MAMQAFDKLQSDPALRDLARRREKFLLDVASSRNSAIRRAKAEGIAIGEARGEAIGEIKKSIQHLIQVLEWNIAPPSDEVRSQLEK